MKKGFVNGYLAGIEFDGFGGIPLIPLGRWLMGVAVILFTAGVWLNRRRNIAVFEMVRFGRKKYWWNMRFKKLFLTAAAGCVGYAFCMWGLDLLLHLSGPRKMEEMMILLLWLVHMMTLTSAFCLLDLTALQRTAPSLLLVVEALTFILGFFCRKLSKFMFGSWGMYMQSSKIEEMYGFSPVSVLILEWLMIITAWKIGAALLEKRDGCL